MIIDHIINTGRQSLLWAAGLEHTGSFSWSFYWKLLYSSEFNKSLTEVERERERDRERGGNGEGKRERTREGE